MPDLLDTNIVSELRKPRPSPQVRAYLASQPLDTFYLSLVTIVEIQYGILATPLPLRKQQLEAWLEHEIRVVFRGRILPVTQGILLRWRILMDLGRRSGRTFPQPDLLLAATALEHNPTLVTRNTRDFAAIPNLVLLNPWEQTP